MGASNWDGAAFEAHRPLLFSIAYRMLGSDPQLPYDSGSRQKATCQRIGDARQRIANSKRRQPGGSSECD